jgi:hypothetical protein
MKTIFFLIIFCLSSTVLAQDDLIKPKPTPSPTPQVSVDFKLSPIEELAKLKIDPLEKKDYIRYETRTWKPVAESAQGPGYTLWLYQKKRVLYGGDIEAWLKIVPLNPTAEQKRTAPKNTSYVMQLFTFHCTDERFSIDQTAFYDRTGRILRVAPAFFGSTYRQPVTPGTVSEEIFEFFCP